MTLRKEWVDAAMATYLLGVADDVRAEIRSLCWPAEGAARDIDLEALIRDVLSMSDGGYAVRYATKPWSQGPVRLAVGAVLLYAPGAPLLRVLVGRGGIGKPGVRVEGGILDHGTKQTLLIVQREFAVQLPEMTPHEELVEAAVAEYLSPRPDTKSRGVGTWRRDDYKRE